MGPGRESVRGLRLLVGTHDFGAWASGSGQGLEREGIERDELRCADRAGSGNGRNDYRDGALHRDGKNGKFRDGGNNECPPSRQRLHKEGENYQIRGLLPRARRQSTGVSRLRCGHLGDTRLPGCTRRPC